MALRRSVTARAKLFHQQQRVAVPFSHLDRENLPRHNPIYKATDILRAGANVGCFYGSRNPFHDRRFAIPAAFAPVSARKLSSQVASESMPVAAIEYVIDYVHTFTGLNWWAAIVMTTVLYRTLILPCSIHHTRDASKYTLIRPQLDEIRKKSRSGAITPAEFQAQFRKLYKKYDVTPFTPVNGILFGGPVFLCFIFAINNMAVKVQSFKEGGVFWFTDLTTPDAMHIMPALTALTCWIMMKHNTQQGAEGNQFLDPKLVAILTIPVTEYLIPKAVCCYWITSHLYTIAYGLVIKKPEVKQMLGIPDIPPPPPSLLKGYLLFVQLYYKVPPSERSLLPPPPVDEASKLVKPRIRSFSVEARIKKLKKELLKKLKKDLKAKGRKKGNKRSSR